MLRHLVPLGWLLVATGAAAGSSPLSGEAIRETVAGAVFEIDTPLGTKLPIRFSEDGQLSAEAPSLAYILGSQSDSGRWWVSGDRLCHKWTRWFDGAIQCLRLSQDGSRFFWRRDDGETGTATIAARFASAVKPPPPSYGLAQPPTNATPEPDKPASSPPASAAPTPPRADPPKTARVNEPAPAISVNAAPSLKRQPAETRKAELSSSPPVRFAGASAMNSADPPVLRAARPAEAKPALPEPSFRVAGVDWHDVLNVRDGPSADYPAIGVIPPQAQGVRIVGPCLSAWCPIDHRGTSGWVNSMYLVEEASVRGSEQPLPSADRNRRQ